MGRGVGTGTEIHGIHAYITPLEWEQGEIPTLNILETQALSGTLRQPQALIISPSGQNRVKGSYEKMRQNLCRSGESGGRERLLGANHQLFYLCNSGNTKPLLLLCDL